MYLHYVCNMFEAVVSQGGWSLWHTGGPLRGGADRPVTPDRTEANWSTMSFKVNDRVVYPHHGAAIIKKKLKREHQGETKEYFVLEMVHGDLTLSVPVDKAEEVGMRPPISKSDVEDLFRLIGKRDVREPANWSRRFKNHQEKMKSGDVYQVAEVVRNLALREKGKGLSTAEKSMLERARGILVSELSFALNVSEEAALTKLEKGLE